jgi:hypothetical protein
MVVPASRGALALILGLALVVPGPVLAADGEDAEEETGPDLRYEPTRFFGFGGTSYGLLSGSETDDTDPTWGFELGGGMRFWRNLSVTGSWAVYENDISGEMPTLLDYKIREDGRSGLVEGSIETVLYRAAVRFDGVFVEGWRFHPHLDMGVLFGNVEAKIDTIDGVVPVPFRQSPDDDEPTDIRRFDSNHLGGFGRFGFEVEVTKNVAVDVGAAYEVVEFPPGTNSISSTGLRLVLRI